MSSSESEAWRLVGALLALVVILFCLVVASPAAEYEFTVVLDKWDYDVMGSRDPVQHARMADQVMVWHAGSMSPMEPVVAKLQREGWPVLWVNADTNLTSRKKWNVTKLPTTISTKNGEEYLRYEGWISEDTVTAMINPDLKGTWKRPDVTVGSVQSGGCPPGGCPSGGCPGGNCPTRTAQYVQRPAVQYYSPGYTPQPDGTCGNPRCKMCYGGGGW